MEADDDVGDSDRVQKRRQQGPSKRFREQEDELCQGSRAKRAKHETDHGGVIVPCAEEQEQAWLIEGCRVEVRMLDQGMVGSRYPAQVLRLASDRDRRRAEVRFDGLYAEEAEGEEAGDGSKGSKASGDTKSAAAIADEKLWPGAAAAGWTVYTRSAGHGYRYVSPSGQSFSNKRTAEEAASSSSDAAEREEDQVEQSCGSDGTEMEPELLIEWVDASQLIPSPPTRLLALQALASIELGASLELCAPSLTAPHPPFSYTDTRTQQSLQSLLARPACVAQVLRRRLVASDRPRAETSQRQAGHSARPPRAGRRLRRQELGRARGFPLAGCDAC